MEYKVLVDILDNLAIRYIPNSRHKLLHVNSREAWIDLMTNLLENDEKPIKMSFLVTCARQWELLLYQKLSLQN